MQFKKFLQQKWIYPLSLFLVMLVAYGLQITKLGFYWDDWQALYLSRFGNIKAYWDFFLSDRPISAWTYIVTMPVLGLHPLAWQLFTLLMRWLSVMGLVWALIGIWPQHRWQVQWMGLLLAIFPGFTQQAISVAYSQHFITYALFTLSLAGMVAAAIHPKKYWLFMPLSAFASLLQMLTMEYFAGLELLRPLILAFIFWPGKQNTRTAVRKILLQWLPFLFTFALFLAYRFVLLPDWLPTKDQNAPVLLQQLISQPFSTLLQFIQIAIQDTLHTSLFAWTNTIAPETVALKSKFTIFSWVIGALIAFAIAWGSIIRAKSEDQETSTENETHFTRQAILLGLAGLILGGIPVWITNRTILSGAWSDRFTLAPMLGAVILIVALVNWLGRTPNRKAIVLAFLLGISVAAHVRTSDKYANHWQLQKQYYWQLHWRIPALAEGTAILSPEIPFSYVSGISMGFAYNILYDLTPDSTQVPYWYIEALRYRNSNVLADFLPDTPITYKELRNIAFEGNTDQALAVNYKPARGCVRVMDPIYRDAPYLSDYPIYEGEIELFTISHTEQILAEPAANDKLLKTIFGAPPVDDWCYYYQRADLARQFENWDSIPKLFNEASDLGFTAYNGTELIPFIEGFAAIGDTTRALELTNQAMSTTDGMKSLLCQTWARIESRSTNDPVIKQAAAEANDLLHCKK